MPAYNAEKFITDSIESVIDQSYTNWELIIIDDGSSDKTLEIANNFRKIDKRIVVKKTEENGGVALARNLGYESATGRFIAFLDSDDLWYPNKLKDQLNFILDAKCSLVYCSYEVIDKDGKSLSKKVVAPKHTSYKSLLRGSKIGCLTVMFDNKIVKEFEMVNIGHEDYHAWLNIIKKYGTAMGQDNVMAKYRVFEDSLSSNKKRAANWQWKIYRETEKLNLLSSSINFIFYAYNAMFKYRKFEK